MPPPNRRAPRYPADPHTHEVRCQGEAHGIRWSGNQPRFLAHAWGELKFRTAMRTPCGCSVVSAYVQRYGTIERGGGSLDHAQPAPSLFRTFRAYVRKRRKLGYGTALSAATGIDALRRDLGTRALGRQYQDELARLRRGGLRVRLTLEPAGPATPLRPVLRAEGALSRHPPGVYEDAWWRFNGAAINTATLACGPDGQTPIPFWGTRTGRCRLCRSHAGVPGSAADAVTHSEKARTLLLQVFRPAYLVHPWETRA